MTIRSDLSPPSTRTIHELIEWLASFGETDKNGVTRLLYSAPWLEAQLAIKNKMMTTGFDTFFDDAGNLFGRLSGTDTDAPVILTGSHIDSVVNGGKYDGSYGIIASLLAASMLLSKYGRPRKTIEVVSLCEEEGSRFPITFWGSGSITGAYSDQDPSSLYDKEGISLKQAMEDAGFGVGDHPAPRRNDIDCFIELHIEQGNDLELSDKSIGIVQSIVGQRRYHIQVQGKSNHAGTTPMQNRQDAMAASAELITKLTNKAKSIDPHFVATVGKIEAKPNTPNVIAGEVIFSLDLRHPDLNMLDSYCADMKKLFEQAEAQSNVKITAEPWTNVTPVEMDSTISSLAYQITEQKRLPAQYMFSGAGHDAQMFGSAIPASLIFVPSRDGISHAPDEFTELIDLQNGIAVLSDMLYDLAY
ncbi:allantoate deiminase [Alteribacillus sp. HJP-4]|uniref:allantoate deiminase n=1 Tax=Alteribacillus sp. HJP-4 TaxID=2775394 RepID=UPI0035CCCC67